MNRICLMGVLLLAAPLFSQTPAAADPQITQGRLAWFTLDESSTQVRRMLGNPVLEAPFGEDFIAWQYQIGDVDDEDFSHYLVFRRSTGKMVSIARNYGPERQVDALFPPAETEFHSTVPEGAPVPFSVMVRRLTGARLLIAIGVAKRGETTGQLLLIRESEVRGVYPWLAEQLEQRPSK